MKVVNSENLPTERVVKFGGGLSRRLVLDTDNMGYTLTKTIIEPGRVNRWHYKNHLETCYCVSGDATLINERTGESFRIGADDAYILDQNDPHTFEAHVQTVLMCVFNPPLTGGEVHGEDDSYPPPSKSPVYAVKSVPIDKVTANDYNPNAVAPPEMELLETSIWEDGYTQPVVVVYDHENDQYVVVDGFHRFCILRDSERIRSREKGMLPVVVLHKEIHDRMASTIRHNRARGAHNIELMSAIVAELVDMGKSDGWICKHIGMSPDEVLRLKQITGLASLFANKDFSESWDIEAEENA